MLRNHAPVTGLEAKFSLEFAVASALVAGKVGLSELTDEFVGRPRVREAMGKLSIATTEARCPLEPAFAFSDRVVLKLRDGRTLDSGEIRFARGNAQLPLRDEELRAKFMDCTSRGRSSGRSGTLRPAEQTRGCSLDERASWPACSASGCVGLGVTVQG